MTKSNTMTYKNSEMTTLPTAMRHSVAIQKYAEAVRIYSETDTPLCEIAGKCGVTPGGLSNYISRYHRDLLLRKYGIEILDCSVSMKKRAGQSIPAHRKYRSAILACSDIAYIEYNISQIAEMFGLDGTGLASQLRFHYPDVIPERERVRREYGLADNIHRGVRQWCAEAYAEAVVMYRDTDMTVREVADACNVSMGGLSQHLQFYNKSIVRQKADRRNSRVNSSDAHRSGTLAGNGQKYGPKPETVEKYAKALELYRSSPMKLKDIARSAGVPYEGLRNYIRSWCRAEKQPARPEPEPVAPKCMVRRADGKLVKRSSSEKYAKAIEEFATSAETLKEIAERHGLVYNSLSAYVRRNCSAEQESHRRIVEGCNP